ncbi:MAG: hypothetical protein WA082_04410 [Candidatus Moraniibacteriota bacterium]
MKYLFKKEGEKDVEVQKERWTWGVVYKDGSQLNQFREEDGSFHQFVEIKQDDVSMFVMYSGEKRIDIVVEGKQIFHFYRNVVFSYNSEDERKVRVYCFGYKNKETGEAVYNYILPDDRVVVSDRDIDVTKFNI